MTPDKLVERTIAGTLGADDLDYSELSSVFRDSQTMLRAALHDNPDNTELQKTLEDSVKMEALLTACAQANEDDDADRLNALSEEIAILTGTAVNEDDPLEGNVEQLKLAIEDNNILAAKAVLNQGIALDGYYGEFGDFPLHWAVKSEARSAEMIRLLLQAGANPAFATAEGYTALHAVTDYFGATDFNQTSEIVRILVQAGADIEARNHYGWTPLLMAVVQGSAEEMHALLANGADANALYPAQSMPEFSRGQTALMGAAFDPAKVELLLSYGADPTATAQDGEDFASYIAGQIDHVTTTREPFFIKLLLRFCGVKGIKKGMLADLAASRDMVAVATR